MLDTRHKILLLLLLSVASCAIIPKEQRKCLKAQERVLERCGLSRDSVKVPFTATVEIKGGRTAFTLDTAAIGEGADTIWRDSIRIIYRWSTPKRDTLWFDVQCPDKVVTVEGTVNCPPTISVNPWQIILWQIWGWVKRLWWLLVVVAISLLLIRKAAKVYFPWFP